MRKIIVGSRRSKLALTQTNWVIEQLRQLGAPFEFEVKEIVTKGDKILDVTLSKVGGKGLFVKEIEHAMLNNEIDMAVHSMKDMPAVLPDGLIIGCVPPREDHRDVLISKNKETFADLPSGAVVGTSSLRRSAQLLAKRPDLTIKWIRGNIDTRLAKLQTEDYDAIVLAAAGLVRMGWASDVITEYLATDVCLPAVGQGALAVECRESDEELREWLQKLNDIDTERAVYAERAFLRQLEGGCQVPIAGYAHVNNQNDIVLTALVASPDGKELYKETVSGSDPENVGTTAADLLIKRGAKALIDRVKEEMNR
ncbi:hydroxymethylbilane synthase [Parageobacillus thermoglucosidasius]|uniref:Porphobilinogen deaminase n=2 Tax=Anoxybacillaceae TaxID=3120669 RepID=A0AB38QY14_PARTM|nr:hydroxymethylbilane synthase [Parageobacillus thermoglucosidasius]AEH46993.1 porphobilinogen deaminase [Parageobacillus thermoglucosidasius C56-YS93]MED4903851.1 hydroxymethylbilane synthase [Parageobacillus thermoglucosidasius]MED4912479.1 hydroxymethylbilane synthase [Parageobacillus thermoglucosidasius]MED4944271.1 hydroxymethylbilane synthase [Parageobacillus thermoglucosidasius]MED4981869.1 hydroxymethylbilane synthase [Parageobacillus thermoglucosidasius]